MPIAGIMNSQGLGGIVSPTLTYSLSSNTYTAKITNKDPSSATLYENANVTPPTTSRGTVAYNTQVTGDTINKLAGGTFYARAKVGSVYSAIVSITFDPAF